MTRAWFLAAALVLLPLLVYWPTIWHEYGFRDDYAHLREVRENPDAIIRLTTSYGRPVFGHVLKTSLGSVDSVADLSVLRLIAAGLLAVVGLLLWRHLRRSQWSELEAATLAAAVTLLPGAQVVAGWAIAWPIALGLALATAGFALADRGLATGAWRRILLLAGAAVLYFIAGLTYQPGALFAVVPLAAVLLLRRSGRSSEDAVWVLAHMGLLFVSLLAAWLFINALLASGAAPKVPMMRFEPDPLLKLLWFLRNPLPNSMALFALRDRFATPPWFWLMLAAVALVILLGYLYGARNPVQRRRWLFAVLVLPFAAHSVSLVASSQAIGYRTLLPLSGLFLVLAMFGLRALFTRFALRPVARAGVCGGILLAAAWLAQHNAFTLIAEPQGREWQLVKEAARRLNFDANTQVFLVLPKLEDRSTARVYADEFGSLSSDSEWAAEEMFKAAMRERFPAGMPQGAHYSDATGFAPPASPVDLIVDMRRLKLEGTRASRNRAIDSG